MTAPPITIEVAVTDLDRKYICADDDCPTFDVMRDTKIVDDRNLAKQLACSVNSTVCEKDNSRESSVTATTCDETAEESDDMDGNEDLTITAAVENLLLSHDNGPATPTAIREEVTEPCPNRQLRFSTLTIREYPRTLGDNVCVMGAPISLDWKFQDESVFELEEYEEACQDTRRTQAELKMPSKYRDKLLRASGFSAKEIQEAVRKSNIARNQRKRTVEMLKMQPVYEMIEKVGRVGKKIPFGKKKDDLHLKMVSKSI